MELDLTKAANSVRIATGKSLYLSDSDVLHYHPRATSSKSSPDQPGKASSLQYKKLRIKFAFIQFFEKYFLRNVRYLWPGNSTTALAAGSCFLILPWCLGTSSAIWMDKNYVQDSCRMPSVQPTPRPLTGARNNPGRIYVNSFEVLNIINNNQLSPKYFNFR